MALSFPFIACLSFVTIIASHMTQCNIVKMQSVNNKEEVVHIW